MWATCRNSCCHCADVIAPDTLLVSGIYTLNGDSMRFALPALFVALLLSGTVAHADTLYNFTGSLQSGVTFSGTIAFSPTGGVLNEDTYTAVALRFSDGSVLDTAVHSIPDSGEHFYTTSQSSNPYSPSFSLITTEVQPGFTSDAVCTITQYCADEMPYFGTPDYRSLSILQGQEIEEANITAPTTSVTPEPSSIALFGTGLLGVAGIVRKRFV